MTIKLYDDDYNNKDICGRSRADATTQEHNNALKPKIAELTESTKFDAGKVRAGLVLNNIPHALLAVSEVGSFGALKYAPNNWKGVDIERFEDALQRHLLAHYMGEVYDAESGLTHLAHATWNMLTILELTLLEDKKKQDASER
jgi:Domain of unknown function (DUF5664)